MCILEWLFGFIRTIGTAAECEAGVAVNRTDTDGGYHTYLV